jgi:hypothetical protein
MKVCNIWQEQTVVCSLPKIQWKLSEHFYKKENLHSENFDVLLSKNYKTKNT